MANHKSAKKRVRQTERKTKRHSQTRSKVRNLEKKLRQEIEKKELSHSEKLLVNFSSQIDKAAKKGIYYKKKASRKISQLAKKVHQLKSASHS